jgi:hypothetical protein
MQGLNGITGICACDYLLTIVTSEKKKGLPKILHVFDFNGADKKIRTSDLRITNAK